VTGRQRIVEQTCKIHFSLCLCIPNNFRKKITIFVTLTRFLDFDYRSLMDIQGVPLNDSTVPIYPAKWKRNLTDLSKQIKEIITYEKGSVLVDREFIACCCNNDGSNANLEY